MQRSPELWFSDGSIVLQVRLLLCPSVSPTHINYKAESTQFRVYRGILTANSPLFADLFSVPQPLENTNLVEGCTVIILQDSVQDLTYFLKALHDSRYAYGAILNMIYGD